MCGQSRADEYAAPGSGPDERPHLPRGGTPLAERVITSGGTTANERVRFAFRLATAREPSDSEAGMLLQLFEKQRARYAAQHEEALKLLSAGEFPRNEKLDAVDLAAWTMVASTILNLDETITRG